MCPPIRERPPRRFGCMADGFVDRLQEGVAARAHRHPPAASRDQRPGRRSSAFRRADASRALVPSFVTQPFVEAPQAYLRIAPAKAVDVGLESRDVEPAKHLMELLAEDEAHDREGQVLERDFLAQY